MCKRPIPQQSFRSTAVETVHENPWFVVKNRDGYFTTEYEYPQVIVLPIVENHSIVMVRAKRPVIEDITLELPGGSAKENETILEAASRGLKEETGITASDLDRFRMLPPISSSPNRNPDLLSICQLSISEDEFEKRAGHDQEVDNVDCLKFEHVKSMIVCGEIYVSVPVAIIGRFFCSIRSI